MLALDKTDWTALIGVLILLGRLLFLLMRFARRLATDGEPGTVLSRNGVFVSGVAVAMMLTAFAVRIAEQFPALRAPTVLYGGSVVLGFILGMIFDFLVDLRLTLLGGRLRTLRIPQYRMQLAHMDPDVRLQAARKLLSVGAHAAPAVPELLLASRDESHEVRAYALLVLWASQSEDEEILRAARSALFDPDVKVRAAAAVCLSRFGHPPGELLPALSDGLRVRGHQVVVSSIEAIRDLGPAAEGTMPAIREVAMDATNPNAADVVYALEKLGPAAIPLLIEVLERGPRDSRVQAIHALEGHGAGAQPAFAALRRAAGDPEPMVRDQASRTLRRLGADLG